MHELIIIPHPFRHFSDEQRPGELMGLTRSEALKRVQKEAEYCNSIINKHLTSDGGSNNNSIDTTIRLHKEYEGKTITILLANKATHEMNAQPLILFCDTAKTMILSQKYYKSKAEKDDSKDTTIETNVKKDIMEISLVEFETDAVVSFMNLLLLLHDQWHEKKSDSSSDGKTVVSSRKRRIDNDADETEQYITELINDGKISERHIVECAKISHYIQCPIVLDALTSILLNAIDSNNCMAMCSLADQLNLKSLFEASVNHVIKRLDVFTPTTIAEGSDDDGKKDDGGSGDDDKKKDEIDEMWSSLPNELRSRVLTMRNVMRSSVIGRGSKVSGLFFSSGDEFLAIFRETIRDKKERLKDAQQRHEEVIREREEEWNIRSERRGAWFDRSEAAKKSFIFGPDVKYALVKIEDQTKRLQTLESFYEEQKMIFNNSGLDSEIRL